uniref:GDNF/GAS1 domain-containing protein n=1 Tax=Stomoxys calcitrans TaxID=35570 RepID=A0A1I8P409_STOCA
MGSNIKVASAILNCILARQLCFEDPSCSAILEIIPRVCGPIPVSCSTVTVTKCQAALRTLQAFQFFRPTCLCKEPGMDPDCNHFRDFLFDHPCGFVLKKAEKDPYPIDALPTCNHALSVCQQERKCLKLFEDFKTHCKVRDNKCKMESRDACHDSWTNLRLSPMFGCICPNNHMKKRCDRIFNIVNHNPCVGGQDVEVDLSTEIIKQHFQSTCHTALDTCRDDPSCASSLQPMLQHCEMHRCNRNACMTSLQAFYKGPHEDLNLDVAFCLCKKTSNRHDSCMIAQEKLHPVCAQRPPDNSNQQSYTPPPSCHAVAEACKE